MRLPGSIGVVWIVFIGQWVYSRIAVVMAGTSSCIGVCSNRSHYIAVSQEVAFSPGDSGIKRYVGRIDIRDEHAESGQRAENSLHVGPVQSKLLLLFRLPIGEDFFWEIDGLIKKGAGEYIGSDGKRVLVTFPGPKLSPLLELAPVRELAGPHFKKLFDAVTVYKPVKAFREVAAALLGRQAAKLVRLCEKDSSPQVTFNA